ncbi:MAG: c-type cytochrome, partial [Nitrospiraceae bacterium]
MKNSFSLKAGVLSLTAFGMILLSGSPGELAFAADALPAGFKTGSLSPEPSADMIEAGKRVYFTKCVWCHGVDGAGDGPGADRLWPRPRNFNQGTFKIRHTASGELPLFDAKKPVEAQNDLFATVTHGLPGSAMPPWEGILTEEQRLQVLSFVTTQLVKDRKFTDTKSESQTVLQMAELKPIAASEESLKKGAELVVEKKCVECHGMEGRGDGNAFNLKDDWGFSIQPANWHKCWNFRGSRQDPYNVNNIFRTFSTGVNGTPMPSFADN